MNEWMNGTPSFQSPIYSLVRKHPLCWLKYLDNNWQNQELYFGKNYTITTLEYAYTLLRPIRDHVWGLHGCLYFSQTLPVLRWGYVNAEDVFYYFTLKWQNEPSKWFAKSKLFGYKRRQFNKKSPTIFEISKSKSRVKGCVLCNGLSLFVKFSSCYFLWSVYQFLVIIYFFLYSFLNRLVSHLGNL